ncbi:MAG: SurA N-terminal domain-containing protein, partial [Pseudomonadota bacterium]
MLRAENRPMPTNAPRLHARAAFATLGVLFSVIAATAFLPTKAIAAGSVKIVAKVGDLVITNFQVDARAALLMQQSAAIRKQAGSSAQSYFKKNVQKRWKKITQTDKFKKDLRDYVIGKKPTSREEQQKYIREFAQKRQRRLQKSLQKEALAHGQRAVGGTLKKKALDNLIDESLKLYEAKRLSVLASYDEAKKSIAQIAQRNNKTVKEFEANLRKSGIQPMTLRDKIRADKSWQNVIRKQYGFQLAMMQSALDRYIDTAGGGNATAGGDVKLDVKRIRIASNDPGAGLVQALQQADGLRNRISGCQSLSGAASTVPGARFEDLGKRTADAIANPVVRELLKKAKVGEPIPPQIESGNVDL